jgi:DNA invertase Pin-like site-specific DNA recombinase
MPTKEAPTDARTPAVLYAAKSTEDKKGSIGTQLDDGRAFAEREGWEVVGEFNDEGFSAYSGNRGPDLERAEAFAAEVAKDRGVVCQLVAQHSDRFARGAGDKPGASFALTERWHSTRRQNVHMRSVENDHDLSDPVLVAVAGKRDHEDSKRKAQAVAAGKQRQTERGERLGGPVPEGYLLAVHRDPRSDEVVNRVYSFDPDREPVIRRILDLALDDVPDTAIARRINSEGFRTLVRTIKTGKRKGQTEGGVAWTRRRVQAVILNPFYSGRITGTIDGERVVVEGEHPGYITPEQQDRLIADRAERDHNQAGHAKVGAPVRNHMLDGGEQGLAGCGRCGGVMYAQTSTYRRKSDGGRARTLMCTNVKFSTGLCDAPSIRLERVEAALVDHLDGMFVDFDGWVAAQTKQRGEAGRVLRADLDRERAAVAELRDKEALLAHRYTEHVGTDDTLAAADAAALKQTTTRREAADDRIAELAALIAEADAPEPVDAALDWFNDLSASVRGALGGDSLRTVNEGLRDTFRKFWLDTTDDGDVSIRPELHPHVAVRLVPSEDGEAMHLTTSGLWELDDEGNPHRVPANVHVEGVDGYLWRGANPAPLPVLVASAQLADRQL